MGLVNRFTSDATLVRRALADTPAAFEELVARYQRCRASGLIVPLRRLQRRREARRSHRRSWTPPGRPMARIAMVVSSSKARRKGCTPSRSRRRTSLRLLSTCAPSRPRAAGDRTDDLTVEIGGPGSLSVIVRETATGGPIEGCGARARWLDRRGPDPLEVSGPYLTSTVLLARDLDVEVPEAGEAPVTLVLPE